MTIQIQKVVLSVFCVASAGCDAALPVESTDEEVGVLAVLDGEVLYMPDGWQEATDCVVWQGVTECFRGEAEANALIQEIEGWGGPDALTNSSAEPQYACSRSCLHLYEHSNFKGRHLVFCDRGYWQNLGGYGFNDKLSSYKTGVKGVHLSKHANGGGPWYPGVTSPCISSGGMQSGWNDEVSAIFIKK